MTIDYTNPLTAESDEKGICSVTVKVMMKKEADKEAVVKHECIGRGTTKKLAKQGAAAREYLFFFLSVSALIDAKSRAPSPSCTQSISRSTMMF